MEYLSRVLKSLDKNPNYNFHPGCEKIGITHLSFVDDLLLFARGDLGSIKLLYEKFVLFAAATGLKENPLKCHIYMKGFLNESRQQILDFLGYEEGDLPVKYLGLPLLTKILSVAQCKPLINKVTDRINNWMARTLSYAGRAQLIKSVLSGIQAYWA